MAHFLHVCLAHVLHFSCMRMVYVLRVQCCVHVQSGAGPEGELNPSHESNGIDRANRMDSIGGIQWNPPRLLGHCCADRSVYLTRTLARVLEKI